MFQFFRLVFPVKSERTSKIEKRQGPLSIRSIHINQTQENPGTKTRPSGFVFRTGQMLMQDDLHEKLSYVTENRYL